MRIAHLSDLHLLDLEGAVPGRLFNKRVTGWLNLKLRRGHKHKPEPVRAAARALRDLGVDHVVVTGDVSNLALEREFDRVRELFEGDIGLDAEQVSVVPGNHDAYTSGSYRSMRFGRWFAPYTTSDLPNLAGERGFPFVRLRGPVAIIGLSTAVSRPPLVASGVLGEPQLERLARILEHPEVRSRIPVILQHHPLHSPSSRAKTLLEGLVDAPREAEVLAGVARGLLLHGHLHRRIHRAWATRAGSLEALGATSASLLHEEPDRMAGFNLYEVDEGGVRGIAARRFAPDRGGFDEAPVPFVPS